ncbi:sugar phosphate isomerase/epimerase family protein [Paenibacillus koleovorans]|uniref:sugar phosphate isomerase/epimerase family protein n=1 Tax=Paenibacillus koleovorans TaxID=121608 RepID=UPI0013E3853E|nr:sugar phosphate isomerase/epimerase [Paenibacillus koleovorans]
MQESWRQYFRIGINHHLLFPDTFESVEAHLRSLPEVLAYPEFEVVDMFIPEEGNTAKLEGEYVARSGKEPVYNCPLMTGPGRNPHSPDPSVRLATQGEVIRHLRRAQQIGARKAVVASGANPRPEEREQQTAWFVDYLSVLCAVVPDIELLIEPFDTSIGKNLLIGPTREAAEVVRQVKERGLSNIGLLIDMGHVPLMGETFAQSLQDGGAYVRHIHLGSCVMRNPANPLYGDMHPPWGYEDGEHDVPELIQFLKALFAAGYLGGAERPTVTLEMRPYPNLGERASVDIFLDKLEQAWKAL